MTIAIKVENLSKIYRLGEIGTGTISRDLERWWAKLRGKEDPFLRIGQTNDRTTKGGSDIVYSLQNINFEIQQGEAVGIIGKNGAGKSTLLKILSQVTSPTTGKINIKGRVTSLLEVGTGFHPELTGRENIFLNGAILGMRKKEITRKLDEIIDFSGVERYIDTPVKRYSSGMYVRLAFAVAAHLESEILIVDEVLAVGDAEFQKKCLGKMGDISKSDGRTILFVSHNLTAIKTLCTRTILIEKGKLILSSQNNNEVIDKYMGYIPSSEALIAGEDITNRLNEYNPGIEKYFNCEEIKICDARGLLKSEFNSDEDIFVSIRFRCSQRNTNLNIIVSVANEEDDTIVRVESMDCENYEKSMPLEKGIYEIFCMFPKNMFGEKVFFISVGLVYHGVHHQVFNKILSFKVNYLGYNYRTLLPEGGGWAYIRPNYYWETKEITTKTIKNA